MTTSPAEIADRARRLSRGGDHLGALSLLETALAAAPGNRGLRMEQAAALRGLGRLEEAEAAYRAVLAGHARFAPALIGLGLCARQRGARAEALEHLDAAAAADPASPWAQLERGSLLRDLDRLAEAEAAFDTALARKPDLAPALLGRAFCLRRRGAVAAARDAYTEATRLDPANTLAQIELAALCREAGDLHAARTAATAVLARVPAHVNALLSLGATERMAGRMAAAREAFDRALAADPAHAGAQAQLAALDRERGPMAAPAPPKPPARPMPIAALLQQAAAAREAGRGEEALALLRTATGRDPGHAGAQLALAALSRDLGDLDAARMAAEAVLAREPGHVNALLSLGVTERRAGRREAARDAFARAAAADPASIPAQLELATLSRDLGDLDAARSAAEAVLAREPGHVNALLSLGVTERLAGRRAAARDAFVRAAAAGPDQPRPLLEQATEALALGDARLADRLVRQAAALGATDPAPLEALAEQARVAGRLPQALAYAEEAMSRAPARLSARFAAAQILQELGRAEEAEAVLEAAMAAGLAPAEQPGLLARRALLRRRIGDIPGALALARAAAAAAPHSFAAWHARCQIEAQVTIDTEALEACFAAAPPPRNLVEEAQLAACRAEAAELRGDLAAAERFMTAALARNPAHPMAHQALARLALRRLDGGAMRRHLEAGLPVASAAAALQGRRAGLVHSLLGQILDELMLEPALLAELAALRTLPPADRLGPIGVAIRAHPDAMAPGLALLGALGRLTGGPAAAGAAAVPPVFGQFWHAGVAPDDVEALLGSWQQIHPAHAVQRFDDQSAAAFLEAHCPPPVLAAFRRADEPVTRANLLRLAWLHAAGGIWVDADTRCLAPLGRVLPAGTTLLAVEDATGAVGTALLAAAPGHPVIARALDEAVLSIDRGDQDVPWLATGPGLLTRALAGVSAAAGEPARLPPGCTVLDRLAAATVAALEVAASYKAMQRRPVRRFRVLSVPRQAGD